MKGKFRFLCVYIIWIGLPCISAGQKQMELNTLLNSYRLDPRWLEAEEQLGKLKSLKYSSPWIRDMDVQLGNRDISLLENTAQIRWNTNNFLEFNAYKKFSALESQLKESDLLTDLNDLLFKRYELAIQYFGLKREKFWLDSLMRLYQNQQIVFETYINKNQKLDLDNLLQCLDEKNRILLRMEENLTTLQSVEEEMKLMTGVSEIDAGFLSHWIQPGEILFRMESSLNKQSPAIMKQEAELALLEYEYRLQKKKEKEWNGFLLMGIRDYDNRQGIEEKLYSRIGISIPLGGRPNKRSQDLNQEISESLNSVRWITQIQNYKVKLAVEKLKLQLKSYFRFKDEPDLNIYEAILNSQVLSPTLEPEALLDIEIQKTKLMQLMDQRVERIMKQYILCLYEQSELIQLPLKNHLMAELVPLD